MYYGCTIWSWPAEILNYCQHHQLFISIYCYVYIYICIYTYIIYRKKYIYIYKNTFPNPVFWMLCLKPLGSSKLSDIDHFIVPELVWGKKHQETHWRENNNHIKRKVSLKTNAESRQLNLSSKRLHLTGAKTQILRQWCRRAWFRHGTCA